MRIRRRLNGKKSRVEREDGFVDGSVEAAKLAEAFVAKWEENLDNPISL